MIYSSAYSHGELPQTVGDLIRYHRRLREWSQAYLAERAQLSLHTVCNLERGAPHRPRKDTLRLLAQALDLTPDEEADLLAAASTRRRTAQPLVMLPDASATRSRLPTPPTPLIGREDAIAQATARLLDKNVRLLTLTGPGGVGKTRLALAVASRVAISIADGCVWIPLAALRDPAFVLESIAQALGLQETTDQPLSETLVAVLRDRDLLLLLDNCEHVKTCAPLLADLLAECPRLRILATSRIPLSIRAEYLYEVAPLPVPSQPDREQPVAEIAKIASVALFLERAQAAQPDVTFDAASMNAIAAICQRLDGLPLALELAAARLRLLTPIALLARLDNSLQVLTSGPQDLPERQRTLHATLDWSYHLLAEDEQTVFRLLAVFAGGASLEAIEAVAQHVCIVHDTLLACISTLVDHHLLRRWAPPDIQNASSAETANTDECESAVRVRMLVVIREYAWERLVTHGEQDAAEEAHAAYYCALAERAEAQLRGPDQARWLARLEQEHDNLRAALQWAVAHHAVEIGLRMAGALWQFWSARGHFTEGRRWLEQMREIASTAEETGPYGALFAKVLNGAGVLATRQCDYAHAATLHEQALALRRSLGDKIGIASSLNNLGGNALDQGHNSQAQALWEESLALRREIGEPRAIAIALMNLGVLAKQRGAYVKSTQYLEESLPLFRAVGDTGMLATALNSLGGVLLDQCDFSYSQRVLEESLALAQRLGQKRDVALALANLGAGAYQQGEWAQSSALLSESLALHKELGDRWHTAEVLAQCGLLAVAEEDYEEVAELYEASQKLFQEVDSAQGVALTLSLRGELARAQEDWDTAMALYRESLMTYADIESSVGVASCLEGLASALVAMGEAEQAMRLCGAAATLRREMHGPRPPSECAFYEQTLAQAQAMLGKQHVDNAFAKGTVSSLEGIIHDVLIASAPPES
jgi:predicted ATPase/transcriptional regulator with XRE-family HTH domain